MLRYQWRGTAAVRVRGLTATLANTAGTRLGPHDQRAVLTAATMSAGMPGGGRIELTTTDLSCMAYGVAPDAGMGESRTSRKGWPGNYCEGVVWKEGTGAALSSPLA